LQDPGAGTVMPSEIQTPPRVPVGAGVLCVGAGVVADGPGSVGSNSSDRLSTEQAPENIEATASIASRVLVLFMTRCFGSKPFLQACLRTHEIVRGVGASGLKPA
jgi:hypothetical protein